jgi:anaerobic magnesium-protoporphyrin IX monomethyl ester cyclase
MMAGGMVSRSGALDVLFLNLPSPPYRNVLRNYAGGFGISLPSTRAVVGHDGSAQPCMKLVYGFWDAVQSELSAGHIDAQAERLSAEELMQRIAALKPAVIMATVSLPSLDHDIRLLRRAKESAGGATIVACGTVCRPDETLQAVLADGTVDIAITGDTEAVSVLLARALLSPEGACDVPGTAVLDGGEPRRVEGGLLTDLAMLPPARFDLLPMPLYTSWEFGQRYHAMGKQFGGLARVFPLHMSRGCPYVCPYCPYPIGVGKKWLHRTPERFVEEMRGVVAAGTHHVVMQDQTIAENIGLLSEICEAIIAENLEVEWLCEARVGSLAPDTLALMRRAGCVRVHYGAETGDPELFAHEAKRFKATPIDDCLKNTRAAGIEPSLHFLVGFHAESWQSISATLDLIERANVTSGDCAIMTPYPGTRYYDEAKASGRIIARSWEDFTGTDAIVSTDHLSPVELIVARWRILSAIQANGHRGLRRRLNDAASALSASWPRFEAADAIDAAVDRSLHAARTASEQVVLP